MTHLYPCRVSVAEWGRKRDFFVYILAQRRPRTICVILWEGNTNFMFLLKFSGKYIEYSSRYISALYAEYPKVERFKGPERVAILCLHIQFLNKSTSWQTFSKANRNWKGSEKHFRNFLILIIIWVKIYSK